MRGGREGDIILWGGLGLVTEHACRTAVFLGPSAELCLQVLHHSPTPVSKPFTPLNPGTFWPLALKVSQSS